VPTPYEAMFRATFTHEQWRERYPIDATNVAIATPPHPRFTLTINGVPSCLPLLRTILAMAHRTIPLPKWVSRIQACCLAVVVIGLVMAFAHLAIPQGASGNARKTRTIVAPRLSGGLDAGAAQASIDGGPVSPRIRVTAAEIIQRGSGSSRHSAAVAALLTGRRDQALAIFREIAPASRDALVWNDFAATNYAIAIADESPRHLEHALAAADEALRLDPASAEAMFNRSLILQRFGLRDLAAQSWKQYLERDGVSEWAHEARQALHALEPPPAFRDALDRAYAAMKRGDRRSVDALAAQYPQECRTWGEVEILGRWAEAFLHHHDSEAAAHLDLAEAFGSAIESRRGEHLLAAAVSAIKAADSTTRRALATAHANYRTARMTYRDEKPAAAERSLRGAADAFAAAKSPMAFAARYYGANTAYDQNRVAQAARELTQLRGELPPSYRALRAHIDWELALCEIANTRWGAALDLLQQSRDTFAALGEQDNASTIRSIVADVYENLGEVTLARRTRMEVLTRLGRTTNRNLQGSLAGMTRTAIREQDWPVALSLLTIETASARVAGNRTLEADALHRTAIVHLRTGSTTAAQEDLRQANGVRAQIPDAALAERLAADQLFIEGVLESMTGDRRAIATISSAIDFHLEHGQHAFLPQMYFARARARRQAGDDAGARIDITNAIGELERQRDATPTGDIRAGILATAGEIFEEAVSLQLKRGDAAAALQYVERSRARVLLDAYGNRDEAQLPPATAALSYFATGDDLHIFVADRRGVSVADAGLPLPEIRDLSRRLVQAAAGNDVPEMNRLGATLRAALIVPVENLLGGARTLVVTGQTEVLGIPFCVLRDASTQRYLIEDFTLIVSPSIAVYSRSVQRSAALAIHPSAQILAVGNPGDDLGGSGREVEGVTRPYRHRTILTGGAATRSAFIDAIASAYVLHFAGHGQRGRAEGEPSLIFSDSQLYASDIQRLKMPRLAIAVLAACDTGRGERNDSEGTWSIARSFLVGGVPTVVATLWPIEDADAPRFFVRLHEHLMNGRGAADAVRDTQLELLRGNGAIKPSIWAAIQVIGS